MKLIEKLPFFTFRVVELFTLSEGQRRIWPTESYFFMRLNDRFYVFTRGNYFCPCKLIAQLSTYRNISYQWFVSDDDSALLEVLQQILHCEYHSLVMFKFLTRGRCTSNKFSRKDSSTFASFRALSSFFCK